MSRQLELLFMQVNQSCKAAKACGLRLLLDLARLHSMIHCTDELTPAEMSICLTVYGFPPLDFIVTVAISGHS